MARGRGKLDKMWRIWYAVLVLLLHAFLLYSAAQRYAAFRVQALRESWETEPMNFYLGAVITAGCLLLLFTYAAFARTGNYAEEGVALGRDHRNLKSAIGVDSAQRPTLAGVGARLRRHFLPYTCVLHLLMAMCLLLPLPVLEAASILHEKEPRDSIWSSDMDFLIRPGAKARNPISAETFNLVLALCILLVRYPSVFWYTNRLFSFLFSVILCVAGLHVLLAYEACAVLFKVAKVNAAAAEPQVRVSLAPAAILALLAASDLLLLLAAMAFFEFGYAQVLTSLRRYRHLLQAESSSSCCGSDRSCSSCAAAEADAAPCWLLYAPHLFGAMLTLAAVLCKAPLLWDWVNVYRAERDPILLLALMSAGAYAALWTAAWLFLGLRSRWHFRVRLDSEDTKSSASAGGSGMGAGGQAGKRRSTPSMDSEMSKRSNQYLYMPRMADCPAGLIPTISEQVDNVSEGSYSGVGNSGNGGCGGGGSNSGCGGGGCGGGSSNSGCGTLDRGDRQSGLVKYQVRRNSAQMSGSQTGSLRRGPGRVTFKDPQHHQELAHSQQHPQAPGSPGSSQNTSSDSGIIQGVVGHHHHSLDEYAQVAKAARQCSFDEYQMFADSRRGEFFQDPPYMSHSELYSRVPILPPPPTHVGGSIEAASSSAVVVSPAAAASANAAAVAAGFVGGVSTFGRIPVGQGERVPDILINRSPYGSLARQPSHKPTGAAVAAARHLGADLANLHAHGGSFGSLPPPPPELDGREHVDGLCSQV